MADHHVRVILEAVDKGSGNFRKFFQSVDKDVKQFRKDLADANKEADLLFTAGGVRGRGASGKFLPIGDVEKAILKLKELREEAQRVSRSSNFSKFFSGLAQGREEATAIRRAFQERIELSKDAAKQERVELDKERAKARLSLLNDHRQEVQMIEDRVVLAQKVEKAGEIQRLRDIRRFHTDKLEVLRAAYKREGLAIEDLYNHESALERDRLQAQILSIERERDAFIAAARDRLRTGQALERQRFDQDTRQQRQEIQAPDIGQIASQVRADLEKTNAELDKTQTKLQRMGREAGRAWSRFRLGVALGRSELDEAGREFVRNEGRLTRIGAAFGKAVRGANQFVNVRWAVIIGFLQLFGTLVVQLGLALVALASSAIQAAGALGGAFLAGLTQLIPVVGLLAAAFSRLSKVLEVSKLQDALEMDKATEAAQKMKDISNATDALADARYALVKAGQAVKDAEYEIGQAHIEVQDAIKDQKEAIRDLAEARREAARDIVDANLEEKEAALALEEANLGILEAKRKLREEEAKAGMGDANIEDAKAAVKEAQARLAQVRSEGDEAEITLALQQLNQAENSLQEIQADVNNTKLDVQAAKNDVKSAQLDQQQAAIRSKRAQEDAAVARKKGVEGSDKVKSAQENLLTATRRIAQAERQQVLANRALADAVHGLAVAKREENKATLALAESQKKQSAQQEELNKKMADLSPAERTLLRSINKLKKVYEKNFRGITDIIILAFSRMVDSIIILLQDPKILSAAKNLATSIGGAIDQISKFAVSPEFRRFLTFTINEAAKNVPKITSAFLDFFRVIMRISQAASPLFSKLLDRFQSFAGRLEKSTRDTSGLDKFFATAGRHLDAWIRFAGAVGRVLGFVVKLSAPAGKGMLEDLTGSLNDWADWLDNNETKVLDFFRNVRTTVQALGRSLGVMAKVLFEAFSSKEASELSQFLLETVIPAFAGFLVVLGQLAGLLNTVFGIPVVGQLAKWAIQLGIIYGLMIKLFPVSKKLFALIRAGVAAAFSGAALAALKNFIIQFRAFLVLAKQYGVINALSAAFPKLAAAIRLVGAALKFVFITNPWIAVIVGIIAAVVLLDRKFHFIAPTIKWIGKLFKDIWGWIKKNWKLLVAILLGPFAIVALAIYKWHDKIMGFIEAIINFIRKHWKTILAIFIAPLPLILLALYKWRDKIWTFFRELPGKIVGFFKKLPENLAKIFRQIPGLLMDALKGLQGIVESALRKALPGPLERRLFGNSKTPEDELQLANESRQRFMSALPGKAKRRAKELQGKGKTYLEVMNILIEEGFLNKNNKGLLQKLNIVSDQEFAAGGTVAGGAGKAVPVIAHAGEWILNKAQQSKVSERLGMSKEQVGMWLFGTKGKGPQGYRGHTDAQGKKKGQEYFKYANVNLLSVLDEGSTDSEGNPIPVWFIEMADGAFGQVSQRDAAKIKRTNGSWVPGYVKRSSHGFNHKVQRTKKYAERLGGVRGGGGGPRGFALGGVVQAFANGGVVQNWAHGGIQSFAEGGTVLQQGGIGDTSASSTKNINQNFNVTTQGETDWNYVLRIGAMHAQGSYT